MEYTWKSLESMDKLDMSMDVLQPGSHDKDYLLCSLGPQSVDHLRLSIPQVSEIENALSIINLHVD
jgi:hypothetical protein